MDKGYELITKLDYLIERWKPIEDYENYSVSTFGRIRKECNKKILKPSLNTTKYYMIDLVNNEKYTKQLVSRLVAKAFLINPENKPFVDHINGKVLDNHFLNLKWATRQENGINRKLQTNNKTGHTGISKRGDKYCSQLRTKGKTINLGIYEKLEDAIKARKEGELKYFGQPFNTIRN